MPRTPFACFFNLQLINSVVCQTPSLVALYVNFANKEKYLGVMINSSFKTTIDVQRQTRNFSARANLLIHNFRFCTDNVKCYLFQSYCTDMYCCQLWLNSAEVSLKKLRTSYNSALRRFLVFSKPYSACFI